MADTSTKLSTGIRNVLVPDIGNFKDVAIIEVSVKPGDTVVAEQALISLETDKATIDVPAPFAGVVKEVKVKVGDKVSEGALIVTIESSGETSIQIPPGLAASTSSAQALSMSKGGTDSAPTATTAATMTQAPAPATAAANTPFAPAASTPVGAPLLRNAPSADKGGPGGILASDKSQAVSAHASPSIRRFARELGVNLPQVKGSGEKGRVTKEDVQNFVKQSLAGSTTAGGGMPGLLPWPDVDFARFGAIEAKPLSRIKKISGANLHRNWVMIPHVTQFDEADITDMEAWRKELNAEYAKKNIKITPLAFMLKAVVAALQQYPEFNASLDASGENLVLKKYFHIGVAVDTPDGLMVPVIRDVDKKGIVQLAKELGEVSTRARDKKLSAADMQGGCFSISSLGGIGGTAFTPIINAPEVAILGLSKGYQKPVWDGKAFQPRLTLPLSLSYDHRVIDGADAARFLRFVADALEQPLSVYL